MFGYGTPPFNTLDIEFRRRVLEEAAGAGLDLIFTLVWDFADPADVQYVEWVTEPYRGAGAAVRVAELLAPLEVRLDRNRGQDRLDAKPSKRDLPWSDQNVRTMEGHVLDSADNGVAPEATALLQRLGHRRFDSTERTATDTAAEVLAWVDTEDGGNSSTPDHEAPPEVR